MDVKNAAGETGLFMVGGGVPKNFTQDAVLAPTMFNKPPLLHKYAIQLTVADERDGALSSSTLQEAHSWGKVADDIEQMVFGEATLTMPLIVGYGYHKGAWKTRKAHEFSKIFKDTF